MLTKAGSTNPGRKNNELDFLCQFMQDCQAEIIREALLKTGFEQPELGENEHWEKIARLYYAEILESALNYGKPAQPKRTQRAIKNFHSRGVSFPQMVRLLLAFRQAILSCLRHSFKSRRNTRLMDNLTDLAHEIIDRQLVTLSQFSPSMFHEELNQNINRLIQLFTHIPDIVYSYSPQRGFIFVSSASEKLLEVGSEEFYQQGFNLFIQHVHPNDRLRVLSRFKQQLQDKSEAEFEFRMFHRNRKQVIHMLNRSLCILDHQGEVITVDGIIINLNHHKKMEHDIQLRNRQLEFMADELRKTNQQLLELDRRKSELINMIAHDLRNPLNSIRLFTELLLMYKNTPEEHEDFLRRIDQESHRLINLVDNFLDLRKNELGMIKYHREPTNIATIIQHFIYMYECEAERKNIKFFTDGIDIVPLVMGDQYRIGQIISNILANALKFTPQGGKIAIRAKTTGDKQRFVQISIQDSGPGIPAQYHRRIFDKFFQINQEEKNDGHRQGVGLGLAIAREMVEHQGGQIWVESEENQGTTFCFTLPAKED